MNTRLLLLCILALVLTLTTGGCTAASSPEITVKSPEPTAGATAAAATATVMPATATATAAIPTSTPVPTSMPIPTSTPTPAPATPPPYVADPAALADFSYDGWQIYGNAAYGFDLHYPAGWVAAEVTNPDDTMYGHRVTLTDPANPAIKLHIAFKDASEDRQITPTGIGGGELMARGAVPFLGQPLLRRARVDVGEDMGVLYGERSEVKRGRLVFWMALNYAGNPMTGPGLSAEVQATADAIVASVSMGDDAAMAEHSTYREEVLGFEFDYPAGWTLYDVSSEIKRKSIAYSVTLASWPPQDGGREGIPPGETKMDITVLRGDPITFEEAVTERRRQMETQEMPETVLSEADWTLPGGLQAVRWQVESTFGRAAVVLTVINGQTVLVSGFGDEADFDAVARTLRPSP